MIKSHFLCFLKIHKHLNVISKIKLRFFWHLTVNLIFVSYIQNIHTYKHIDHLYKYVHTCTYLHRYFEVSSQPFHLKKDKELHVHDSDFHSHELSSCSALQCVAVRCSALQCVAVRCSALQFIAVRVAVHCSSLQRLKRTQFPFSWPIRVSSPRKWAVYLFTADCREGGTESRDYF